MYFFNTRCASIMFTPCAICCLSNSLLSPRKAPSIHSRKCNRQKMARQVRMSGWFMKKYGFCKFETLNGTNWIEIKMSCFFTNLNKVDRHAQLKWTNQHVYFTRANRRTEWHHLAANLTWWKFFWGLIFQILSLESVATVDGIFLYHLSLVIDSIFMYSTVLDTLIRICFVSPFASAIFSYCFVGIVFFYSNFVFCQAVQLIF